MKRYSFSTFRVEAGNRRAFEICRAIADLRPVSPLPVVLLGDQGCGKTHLLYSIVNQVRAGTAKAALACVTAREFPNEVLALAKDPAPVEQTRVAILLVDHLEAFDHLIDELEVVVRVFLDNQHYVLFASTTEPKRLKNLTPGLRSIIEHGLVVPVTTSKSAEPRKASADLLRSQETEILRLREALAQAEPNAGTTEEAAELRRKLEAGHNRIKDLTEQLKAERETQIKLNQEAEKANAEITALRRVVDKNEAEIAALLDLNEEVTRLTTELERVEAARTAAEHECERLAAQLAERAVLEEDVQSLRLELHRARGRYEQAQEEANRLLERAQAVLTHVEESRAKFAETEQKHLDQIRSLEAVITQQQTPAGGACSPEEQTVAWRAVRDGQAARLEELEAQLAAAKAEARQAARSRDEVIEKLDQLTAAHASLGIEMEGIREQTDERLREMEALRLEAAAQVAAANAQAGDIERENARLRAAMDWSHQTSHVVVAGLQSLHQQLAEMAQEVGQLTERLIKLAQADHAVMDERSTYQSSSRSAEPESPEAMSLQEPVGFQPSSSES